MSDRQLVNTGSCIGRKELLAALPSTSQDATLCFARLVDSGGQSLRADQLAVRAEDLL